MTRASRNLSSTGTTSSYDTRARLWRWTGGKVTWYFVTLPAGLSREIGLVDAGPQRRGFGALRVEATIGDTTWRTSIFPAAKLKAYLLPVKAAVRKAETLREGRMIRVRIVVTRAW